MIRNKILFSEVGVNSGEYFPRWTLKQLIVLAYAKTSYIRVRGFFVPRFS